jgi:hypothetical protein
MASLSDDASGALGICLPDLRLCNVYYQFLIISVSDLEVWPGMIALLFIGRFMLTAVDKYE